jgi:hypothetical protein
MSADDSADPGRQRTVAELLAQHGGAKAGGSRRRRRAPDDDEPSAVAQTGGTDLGATGRDKAAPRDVSATRGGRRAAADAQPSYPSTSAPPQPQVPEQRWSGAPGYGQSIDPLTGEPIDTPPAQSFGAPPRNAVPSTGATGSYRSMPLTRTDPPTEEMLLNPERSWGPRAKDAGPMTGPITGPAAATARAGAAETGANAAAGPATGHVSRADLFDEDDDLDDEHDDDLDDELDDELDDDLDDGAAGRAWGRRASAAPAGLAERDERGEMPDEEDLDRDERPEGVVGWLGLLVQWVVGAVAGALLWVGFSYLWMHFPVVALIAAVLATAVLVLVVRAIRRSDDLQTTMLAVLVGLVVTISPAVLLLAVR